MKVKAKTNVKYNADWFFTGMTFDVNEADLPSLVGLVEVVEAPAVTTQPEPVKEEEPAVAEKAPETTEAQEKPKTAPARRKKASA